LSTGDLVSLAFFGLVLIGAIAKHQDDALTNAEDLRYRAQAIRNECFELRSGFEKPLAPEMEE
jgi:hypothetical protein